MSSLVCHVIFSVKKSLVCHCTSHFALFMACHAGLPLESPLFGNREKQSRMKRKKPRKLAQTSIFLPRSFIPFSLSIHTRKAREKGLLFLLENTRPQGVSGFWDFATSPVHLFLRDRYFLSLFSW